MILEAVKRAIHECGVSQAELARRAQVDRANLNRWMTGRGTLTIETLERIMAALRLRVIADGGTDADRV